MLQFVTSGALALLSGGAALALEVHRGGWPPFALGLLSLASLALMGREFARHLRTFGPHSGLWAYTLCPWLAALAFTANHTLITSGFLLARARGDFNTVKGLYLGSGMIVLLALAASLLAALHVGRRDPLRWRLAVMTGVLAVPAWCLGAAAAIAPCKQELILWWCRL